MRESRRSLRRREIVAAARRLVAREGLEALTIAALEKRLDYTRGVITYHFRDKLDLVHAVLESAVEEIGSATLSGVRESPGAAGKIEAVLRGMVGGFLERREAGLVLLSFWSRLNSDPRSRRLNARLYRTFRRQSALLLRSALRTLEPASVSPEPSAVLLVGLVLGIAAQAYFDPGAVDVEAALREAARLLRAGLKEKAAA